MHPFQKKHNIAWASVVTKTAMLLGIAIWYLLVLLLRLVELVFDLIEHSGNTEEGDIGAHYNVHSGDFDSVQQYDGVYMDNNDD